MTAIHVIEKLNNLWQIPNTSAEWESGYWAITSDTAQKLIDGDLFLHGHQTDPSHFGGVILSFRLQPEGEYKGRVIFRFRYSPSHKKVKTSKQGWGNEKKIVF